MQFRKSLQILCAGVALVLLWKTFAWAGAFRYQLPDRRKDPVTWSTVVGFMQEDTVGHKETLLDIARRYGLGFNEIQLLHSDTDPWIPESGRDLAIPTQWVLPPTRHKGIVINLPEMRLYHFFPRIKAVKTYPVGIGDRETQTPEGVFWVVDRSTDPTWTIPESLREKYDVASIPPGPQNPLGKYWLGISRRGYGIHGTNFPWCVGRSVSNGCIRMYPEHIEPLFQEVRAGTVVEIIYEPVKVGFREGNIFVEVHPDIYEKIDDMEAYAIQRVREAVDLKYVSMESLQQALEARNGVPVLVGSFHEVMGDGSPLARNHSQARLPETSVNGNHQQEKEGKE